MSLMEFYFIPILCSITNYSSPNRLGKISHATIGFAVDKQSLLSTSGRSLCYFYAKFMDLSSDAAARRQWVSLGCAPAKRN